VRAASADPAAVLAEALPGSDTELLEVWDLSGAGGVAAMVSGRVHVNGHECGALVPIVDRHGDDARLAHPPILLSAPAHEARPIDLGGCRGVLGRRATGREGPAMRARDGLALAHMRRPALAVWSHDRAVIVALADGGARPVWRHASYASTPSGVYATINAIELFAGGGDHVDIWYEDVFHPRDDGGSPSSPVPVGHRLRMGDDGYREVGDQPPPSHWDPHDDFAATRAVAARALGAAPDELRGFGLILWEDAADAWAIALGPDGEAALLPMVACGGDEPRPIATIALGTFERLQVVLPLALDRDGKRSLSFLRPEDSVDVTSADRASYGQVTASPAALVVAAGDGAESTALVVTYDGIEWRQSPPPAAIEIAAGAAVPAAP
jgi:hypothetical protein